MSRRTKAQQAEYDEAIAKLREWIKPGDTVYTILDSVSRSGMSRQIRVVVPYTRDDGTIDHLHPNHAVGVVTGHRQAKRGDGLIVGGCGMDMGFALVYSLSQALYGARLVKLAEGEVWTGAYAYGDAPAGYKYEGGYPCLGKGKCPSNYHVNHRDRIRCEGVELGRDEHGDLQRRHCYAPEGWGSRYRDIPKDWPRRVVELDGEPVEAGYLACLSGSGEDGQPYEVCPTCQGAGDVPNPEGPERWDLVHTDGYALRHRWL